MKLGKSLIFFLLSLGLSVSGLVVLSQTVMAAYQYDLALNSADLRFSKTLLISGEKIRIYASVRNVGSEDMLGHVTFLKGAELIGDSQPISVLPGRNDDVFVDFTVPDNSFNIQAKIQGTSPADQNESNNVMLSKVFEPEHDTDKDGIIDSQDLDDDNDGLADNKELVGQCPDRLIADSDNDGVKDGADAFPCDAKEQLDSDGDGLGNNADIDDDNDGWSDVQEQARGTDPLRPDTDNDGVKDSVDAFPLDAKRNKAEVQPPIRDIFQPSPATPANKTDQGIKDSPEAAKLAALEQELKDLGNQAALDKIKEQPIEKAAQVVEQVAGASRSFFRLNNWLIWLAILVLGMIALAVVIFLKMKKSPRFNEGESEDLAETNIPVAPLKVNQPSLKKPSGQSLGNLGKSADQKVSRASSYIIDLKQKLKNHRENE